VIQGAIAGAVLILLPLSRIKRSWPAGTGTRMGAYFFALGLAFLFVEMAFIQKFILFLSHPLYAVAVVLSGFLIFAGLGSAYSPRLAQRLEPHRRSPVTVAVAGILIVSLIYVTLLPMLFDVLIGLADGIKMAVSIVLIAPLAFCMGMPFPIGLSRLADNAPDFIPWAWGSARGQRAGLHPLGLGHQRLRLGHECCIGDAARDRVRFYGGGFTCAWFVRKRRGDYSRLATNNAVLSAVARKLWACDRWSPVATRR
jgi:hypothetical protein